MGNLENHFIEFLGQPAAEEARRAGGKKAAEPEPENQPKRGRGRPRKIEQAEARLAEPADRSSQQDPTGETVPKGGPGRSRKRIELAGTPDRPIAEEQAAMDENFSPRR